LALPSVIAPPPIASSQGPLSVNTVNLMNQSLASKAVLVAYSTALSTSINRYSTALSANDLLSAALQRNAILAYEDSLVALYLSDADVNRRLLSSFLLDGFPNVQLSTAEVALLQSSVAANGLPSRMVQILQQLGLTQNDIQSIQSTFVSTSPASISGSF